MATSPREHIQKLLASFDNGMLVTHADDGSFHSRPMAIADRDANGDIWFVTAIASPKVAEVKNDQRAVLTLQSGAKYVSVTGSLELVRDRAKVDALWNESFKVWFPQGKDDPSLQLMRLVTSEAEYWDNSGIRGLKFLVEAAKAYATGERPKRGDKEQHATVKLS